MSLKNQQNLLIIGAVVAALLAGTILLGNYANILPTGSDSGAQVQAYQPTDHTPCPGPKADFAEAENAKGYCSLKIKAVSDEKTCPLGRTEPCCAEEGEGCCCPKKAEGCCPKEAEGCCPKEAEGCCPKEAEDCCPKEAKPCCP